MVGWQQTVNTAVAVVSRTQAFTKAHVKYLEWYCLGKATEVGRYAVENTATPNEPHVTEPMLADLTDSFETLGSSAKSVEAFRRLI